MTLRHPIATAIPASLIDAIKNTPSRGAVRVGNGELVKIDEPILRANSLTLSPGSRLVMNSTSPHYLAIAVKELVLAIPATDKELARIERAPDSAFGDLQGVFGTFGADGECRYGEDGSHGGNGRPGTQGGDGLVVYLAPIFFFFQTLRTTAGSPAGSNILRILAQGVPGGKGGMGGTGGNGGFGARGTPSSSTKVNCNAGPGQGGNGGYAGKGGKGGPGGRGGDGADVYVIAPQDELARTFFDIQQAGAPGGVGGDPGTAGKPGNGGSAGVCRFPCTASINGNQGFMPHPIDLGRGDDNTKAMGSAGGGDNIARSNIDLF